MNKPFPNGRFSAGSTTLSRTGLAPPQVVLFWSTSFAASNNSLLFQESFERRILTRHLHSLVSGKKTGVFSRFPLSIYFDVEIREMDDGSGEGKRYRSPP